MRYLILIAVLLIPVWGWAQLSDTVEIEEVWTLQRNDPIATCDIDYTNCSIIDASAFPCYQKMLEAMKAMDAVKNHSKADYYGIEFALTHMWIAQHWEPVIKDCVEGK